MVDRRGPRSVRHRRLVTWFLVAVLVGGSLASCSLIPGQPTGGPAATLNPTGHVGLGAYLDGTPFDGLEGTRRFESLIGHKLQYVLWFQSWGDEDSAFSQEWISQAARAGLIPVITWEPWKRNFDQPAALQEEYSLASIAEGRHDTYIRAWARGARAARWPVVIRFAHEQSSEPGSRNWYPWQGDPGGYKAAYRHIVSLFREEGAGNVLFLWSAMWLHEPWVPQYYPGDDVVDMVGTTVLNHGTVPTVDWARWASFRELFDPQYQAAKRWGKPIMVTELATAEQGGNKAAWLRDCMHSLKSRYPLVEGVLLLEMQRDREWNGINWSVGSTEESLAAFREAIADPYFR